MIETFTFAAALAMLAKKGKGKGRSRFQVMRVTDQLALSTLADMAVIAKDITATTQANWVISADLTFSLRGGTSGEAPITFGLCSDDLSVTEIGEALDASPTSEADRIARERASRPVRMAGTFPGLSVAESFNDGKPKRIRCGWAMSPSTQTQFWCRNESGSALTGGQIVEVHGKFYINWR